MSRAASAMLQGIDIGGARSRSAFQLALELMGLQARIAENKRRGDLDAAQETRAIEAHDSGMAIDDARLAEYEREGEEADRALIERGASQRALAELAAGEGLFTTPHPETGGESSDVEAYELYSQLPPDLQQDILKEHRTKQEAVKRFDRQKEITQFREDLRQSSIKEKVAYWEGPGRAKFGNEIADRQVAELLGGDVDWSEFEPTSGKALGPEEHAFKVGGAAVSKKKAELDEAKRQLQASESGGAEQQIMAMLGGKKGKKDAEASIAERKKNAEALKAAVARLGGELSMLERQQADAETAWYNARLRAGDFSAARGRAGLDPGKPTNTRPPADKLPKEEPTAPDSGFEDVEDEWLDAALDQLGVDASNDDVYNLARQLKRQAGRDGS